MNKYQIAFVFFIESEDTKRKSDLVSALNRMNSVTIIDIYDDGEDWNVECIAEVESGAKRKIDDALHNKLKKMFKGINPPVWDYHYIKGLGNDFYWCP